VHQNNFLKAIKNSWLRPNYVIFAKYPNHNNSHSK